MMPHLPDERFLIIIGGVKNASMINYPTDDIYRWYCIHDPNDYLVKTGEDYSTAKEVSRMWGKESVSSAAKKFNNLSLKMADEIGGRRFRPY
jgi:hypothetical protein